MVDKYHSLIFNADRELKIIRTSQGKEYIQVIAATPDGGGILQKGSSSESVSLPDGW